VVWGAVESSSLPITTFVKTLRADARPATKPEGSWDVAQAVEEVADLVAETDSHLFAPLFAACFYDKMCSIFLITFLIVWDTKV
jgi:hypothetical protein